MSEIKAAIMCILIVGGLYYFWFKCRIFSVGKFSFFLGLLIWPIGAIIGIWWALNDFFIFNNISNWIREKYDIKEDQGEIAGCSLDVNDAYLKALEEYESGEKDRALYARLFAENDGSEDLVKAKYIKARAEKLIH